ncbi:MAG: PQQ-binding-like beta-propeller repeat protein [Bacteroidales bacterium]|jgi:outer membrane protein assembly factor BamB|nr:PQQ-binding-like beta-propeller repeat protein [Bacteroidales bacterium]
MNKNVFVVAVMIAIAFLATSCKKYEDVRLNNDKQSPHLHPAFAINSDEYYVGDTVYFTDKSTTDGEAIVDYYWYFGFDGKDGISHIKNPYIVYPYSGNYIIKLTVTDAKGGYATKTDTLYMRPANQPPAADFTISPDVCTVNEEITLTDISVDDDGQIVSRLWDLGNGNTSTDSIVRVTYTETGLVTVSLTVADRKGLSAIVQKTINIRSSVTPGSFAIAWTRTFETSSTLRSISPAVGGNGNVYVASNAMKLYAYSPTGEQQWAFDLSSETGGTGNDQGSSPAVGVDGTVYIGVYPKSGDICMYAVNPEDGSKKWSYSHNAGVRIDYTSPAITTDGNIILGTRGTNGRVHKVNKETGANIWKIEPQSGGVKGCVVIDRNMIIYSAITGESGISRTNDNISNATKRAPAWGSIAAANGFGFAISENTIYVAYENGTIAAYDQATDALKWTSASYVKFERSGIALSENGVLYAGSADGASSKLIALNAATGAQIWAYEAGATINSAPAVDNLGNIHFGDNSGYYTILSPDGSELHKEKLGTKIECSPVISDYGTIYICVEDNGACKLVAIDCGISGPANSPWAQRGQNARRTGLQK